MVIPQYSLAWEAFQKNICNGIGNLQEKGEFVDMTVAADGHYVKVHKMVMCLVSPYIKELISSANCPHPVIFLNNVSFRTLSLILEYIYTGQVCVSKDSLGDLIQAGKALCIKGLVDMVESCYSQLDNDLATLEPINNTSMEMHDYVSKGCTEDNNTLEDSNLTRSEPVFCDTQDVIETDGSCTEERPAKAPRLTHRVSTSNKTEINAATKVFPATDSRLQYTMSNQGSLQIVLNRYVYNVRYMYKNSNRRMWRCIFYPKQLRCPAYVITENDDIVERCCTHNHSFHDKNIMRKVRDGRVFSVLKDAQLQMEIHKRTRAAETPDD